MRWSNAKYYDLFNRRKNIGFFIDLAKKAGRVLDIGAGAGRVSIAMAETGASIFAIEQDQEFIDVMKENLEKLPEDVRKRVTLIKGDALNVTTIRKYPLIILAGVFEYFYSREQRFQVLNKFHDLLKPGGELVFDLMSVNIGDFNLKEVDRITEGNEEYVRLMSCTIDKDTRTAKVRYIYETYVSGNFYDRAEEIQEIALVDPEEISEGLIEAGFREFKFHGGYDRKPYDLYSRILVVEAIRG